MVDSTRTSSEEAEFRIDELFFSRTDPRGVIAAGNSVFQRVSKYEWADLLGAPHKVIRHPDTPRAVFHLMWDTIKQGEPVGAYVKNRASDGSYYWVFAVIAPIPDGYLSVRLKPSSAHFDEVRALYADLCRRETAEGLAPADSAAILGQAIVGKGAQDYAAFMTRALIAEAQARDAALPDRVSRNACKEASDLRALAQQCQELAGAVLSGLSRVAGAPVNMQIQASKLPTVGALFNEVAMNYERLAKRVTTSLETFREAARAASASVDRGLFRMFAATLQGEMVRAFQAEIEADDNGDSPMNLSAEIERLTALHDTYTGEVRASFDRMAADCRKFGELATAMLGSVEGLALTQTVGLIEAARLDAGSRTLRAMLMEMDTVQSTARADIKKLISISNRLQAQALLMGRMNAHAPAEARAPGIRAAA